MSDTDLAQRAPVIMRASVVETHASVEDVDGRSVPYTVVTLRRIEALKGSPDETITLKLPGGRVEDRAWRIPGTPAFSAGGEVVLMLGERRGPAGRVSPDGVRPLEVRPRRRRRRATIRRAPGPFGLADDLAVSKRAAADSDAPPARDADSFLAFLRAVGRGAAPPEVTWAAPAREAGSVRQKWVNIGGREPGDCGGDPCLFRWFWSSGDPANTIKVVGTQTGLSSDDSAGCGTDSLCDVQNAIDGWHGVADADVHIDGPSPSGNVTVNLDATESFEPPPATKTWTTPADCSGGVIGLAGPDVATGPRTFKGDGNYYGMQSATVSMRKVVCSFGYSARTFKTAVMHEIGHTLGLGHPDDDGSDAHKPVESLHSTTTSSQWANAVMHSVIPAAKPEAPQTDDAQAIVYYYGTAAGGALPVANFTASASPTVGVPVAFTDKSTGSPTGWNWDFGDPDPGTIGATTQNPTHTFLQPRTYTVTLSAGNANGTNAITKQITVAPGQNACQSGSSTLCLQDGRFQVTAAYRTADGRTGLGHGTGLTTDSGYFWFFDATNIELVVKVLNGCGLTNHYWVFSAGLTNVEVTLTVVDTRGGASQTYTNPLGTAYAPVQDTQALASCP